MKTNNIINIASPPISTFPCPFLYGTNKWNYIQINMLNPVKDNVDEDQQFCMDGHTFKLIQHSKLKNAYVGLCCVPSFHP